MKINVGDVVFVRSNTRDDYIGRVASMEYLFVELDQCSWIGSSGRFGMFMRNGIQSDTETEYIGDGFWTTKSAIKLWHHELPTEDQPQ